MEIVCNCCQKPITYNEKITIIKGEIYCEKCAGEIEIDYFKSQEDIDKFIKKTFKNIDKYGTQSVLNGMKNIYKKQIIRLEKTKDKYCCAALKIFKNRLKIISIALKELEGN